MVKYLEAGTLNVATVTQDGAHYQAIALFGTQDSGAIKAIPAPGKSKRARLIEKYRRFVLMLFLTE